MRAMHVPHPFPYNHVHGLVDHGRGASRGDCSYMYSLNWLETKPCPKLGLIVPILEVLLVVRVIHADVSRVSDGDF